MTVLVDQFPPCSGKENEIESIIQNRPENVFLARSSVPFSDITSAFCIALHMHQPMIPAGGSEDLTQAKIISNLEHMFAHPDIGDNHNASVFEWCYKRIGEFVPELVSAGKQPRAMLDYSGTLLHGLVQMGRHEVIEALRQITTHHDYWPCIEWLGCPWGHAVAPSTPVQDFRLHVLAWQQHFLDLFGKEALERVRGFSPAEMALPNHPDVAYEFVKTLRDAGFTWVLVQEHTVEQPENGHSPEQPHLPHTLVCRNSEGQEITITALVKTQGSDTKLVAQMQPYFEAESLQRMTLDGHDIPPLVSQIADGENGGVMMNEFPPKYKEVVQGLGRSGTAFMNGTEYLEHLQAAGVSEESFPKIQPIFQKRIWEQMNPGDGPEKLKAVIEEIQKSDHQFHMDGGSWTNNISWVEGYDDILGPMEKVSSLFHENILKQNEPTSSERYQKALYYLMLSQTSCYRYWGQGLFADYGREICRRAQGVIES